MTLRITEDGRVFDGNRELFELTMAQQDQLIRIIYPENKELRSVDDFSRKQTSWSGIHGWDLTQFEDLSEPYVDIGSCPMAERVYKWGGQRLLTLYCHRFNFEGAAMDLGLTYGALMKWFQRWRTEKLALGLTPEHLFRDPDEVIEL